MVNTTKAKSGASVVKNIIRQRFLGDVHDNVKEQHLEDIGSFCHTDFALELMGEHLYLFAVKGVAVP